MPKAFSTQEKELIKKALLERGRELFSRHGLEKTSIKDLTEEVGISQGSFYTFFNSKEELYFAVLEAEERKIKAELVPLLSSQNFTAQILSTALKTAFREIEVNPLLKSILKGDTYKTVLRKLPEDKIANHQENDLAALLPLIEYWKDSDLIIDKDPQVLAGLLRSLFLLSLHKQEIGSNIYHQVIDLLIDFVAQGLVKEANHA